MNIAIDIPDDIGQVVATQAGDVSRVVLEAVAIEAYRSGVITPAEAIHALDAQFPWLSGAEKPRAENKQRRHEAGWI
jgi:hypothetical protein